MRTPQRENSKVDTATEAGTGNRILLVRNRGSEIQRNKGKNKEPRMTCNSQFTRILLDGKSKCVRLVQLLE